MEIIPKIIGAVSTIAVLTGAGVGIGMATNEDFRNDIYSASGVVSEQTHNETKTELEETKDALEDSQTIVTEIVREKEEIYNSNVNLQTQLTETQETVSVLTEQKTALETEKISLEQNIVQLNAEKTEIQTSLNVKTIELSESQTKVSELETEISQIETALAESNSDNEELQTLLDTKTAELTEEQSKVTQLETDIEQISKDKEELNSLLEETELELANKTTELEEKETLIASLESQIEELSKYNATITHFRTQYMADFEDGGYIEYFSDGVVASGLQHKEAFNSFATKTINGFHISEWYNLSFGDYSDIWSPEATSYNVFGQVKTLVEFYNQDGQLVEIDTLSDDIDYNVSMEYIVSSNGVGFLDLHVIFRLLGKA